MIGGKRDRLNVAAGKREKTEAAIGEKRYTQLHRSCFFFFFFFFLFLLLLRLLFQQAIIHHANSSASTALPPTSSRYVNLFCTVVDGRCISMKEKGARSRRKTMFCNLPLVKRWTLNGNSRRDRGGERERGKRRKIRENRVSNTGHARRNLNRGESKSADRFQSVIFPRKGKERNRDPPLSLDRYNILSTAIPYLFYSFPDSSCVTT